MGYEANKTEHSGSKKGCGAYWGRKADAKKQSNRKRREQDKNKRRITMETTKFVYWQDGDMWLGYLEEYPDYMTQGKTLDELKENLKDLFKDLSSGAIPCVRKVAEMEVV